MKIVPNKFKGNFFDNQKVKRSIAGLDLDSVTPTTSQNHTRPRERSDEGDVWGGGELQPKLATDLPFGCERK